MIHVVLHISMVCPCLNNNCSDAVGSSTDNHIVGSLVSHKIVLAYMPFCSKECIEVVYCTTTHVLVYQLLPWIPLVQPVVLPVLLLVLREPFAAAATIFPPGVEMVFIIK